jgi:hypothetical protein
MKKIKSVKNNVILVVCKTNWADEMDLQGFALFSQQEWERHVLISKRYFKTLANPIEQGIGSNQSMIYDSYKDYSKQFKIKSITDKEVKNIQDQFSTKINTNNELHYHKFGGFVALSISQMTDDLYIHSNKEKKWLYKNLFIKDLA